MDTPTKRKLSHKGARKKGKRLERDVADALRKIGINARRVPMSGALSWLKGDVAELDGTKKHIHECKNKEAVSIGAWWRQAASQATDGEIPVLHFSCNYKAIWTAVRTQDFDDLVFAYEQYRPEIELTVVDIRPRTHFWKFISLRDVSAEVYAYRVDKEELIILSLDRYLMFRRQDLKHQLSLAAPSS